MQILFLPVYLWYNTVDCITKAHGQFLIILIKYASKPATQYIMLAFQIILQKSISAISIIYRHLQIVYNREKHKIIKFYYKWQVQFAQLSITTL